MNISDDNLPFCKTLKELLILKLGRKIINKPTKSLKLTKKMLEVSITDGNYALKFIQNNQLSHQHCEIIKNTLTRLKQRQDKKEAIDIAETATGSVL